CAARQRFSRMATALAGSARRAKMPVRLAVVGTRTMPVMRRLAFWLAVAVAAACMGQSGYAQIKPETDTGALFDDPGTKLSKSNKMWSQSDNCGKVSFQKFPDFTEEAALKRDAYMRECLRRHHLAPRNDVAGPLRPGQ